jgi:hypothetical protein
VGGTEAARLTWLLSAAGRRPGSAPYWKHGAAAAALDHAVGTSCSDLPAVMPRLPYLPPCRWLVAGASQVPTLPPSEGGEFACSGIQPGKLGLVIGLAGTEGFSSRSSVPLASGSAVGGRAHFGYPWGFVVPFGTAPEAEGHPANIGKVSWRFGHLGLCLVPRWFSVRTGVEGWVPWGEDYRDGVRAGGFGGSLCRGTLGTGRQRVVLVENAVSRVTTLLPVTKVFIVALLRESAP